MLPFLYLLLPLGTGFPVPGSAVRVVVGQSITLPCTYAVSRGRDITTMCWGHGLCPHSGCINEIIRTDGWKVTWSKFTRYQMKGDIPSGNVSLTIEYVNISDMGTYCCRVEISGWFNDEKHEQTLEVDPGPNTPNLPTSTSVSVNMEPTASYTHQTQVPVSVGTLSQGFTAEHPEESDTSALTPLNLTLSPRRPGEGTQESLRKTNTTIYVVVPVFVLTLAVLITGFYIKRLKTNKNVECISSQPMIGFEPGALVPTPDGRDRAEDNFYIME